MSQVTIYHNPRCSKSRQTLELLRRRGIEPTVVEYLKDAPDAGQLKTLCKMLGLRPIELVRQKESVWKELQVDPDDDAAVLEAMAKHPKLIERPIVVKGSKAALGRPPEQVEAIL